MTKRMTERAMRASVSGVVVMVAKKKIKVGGEGSRTGTEKVHI